MSPTKFPSLERIELPGGYYITNPDTSHATQNVPVEIKREKETLPDGSILHEVVARFTLSDSLGFKQAQAFVAAIQPQHNEGELREALSNMVKHVKANFKDHDSAWVKDAGAALSQAPAAPPGAPVAMSKTITTTIAKRLRSARENHRYGLSQSQVARAAGMHPSAIAHIEAGNREPCAANIVKICKALEISADYLLGLTNESQRQ